MSSGQINNVCQPVLSICIPLQYQLPTYSLPLIPFFFHSDLQEGYKWYCHNFLKFFEIECFAYLGIYKQLNILAILFLYHVNMHAMYFLNILFKCIIQFFLMY